jgi:hypothetical protein
MPPLASIQYPTFVAICQQADHGRQHSVTAPSARAGNLLVSFMSSNREGLRPPRDLVDEVDAALLAARRKAVWDDARVRALEELLETTRRVARELGRPTTLTDLLTAAPSTAERNRRRRLLQALRRSSAG